MLGELDWVLVEQLMALRLECVVANDVQYSIQRGFE
jgi:hypothetical protein